MPRSGDGFWVASVPGGLRVFIDTIRREPPNQFRVKLQSWAGSDWVQGPVKGGSVIWGLMGRTPVYIDSDAMRGLIAVEAILPPSVATPTGNESPLVVDGEAGRLFYNGDGKRHYLKIYDLSKTESEQVCKLISLMYRKDATEREIENMIPPDEVFRVKHVENARAALINDGLGEDTANHIIKMIRRCGKWRYTNPVTKEHKVIEITSPDGEFDTHAVEAPW
jgi:hypothetical protein